jgi:RNA polymerase sigma-B factor
MPSGSSEAEKTRINNLFLEYQKTRDMSLRNRLVEEHLPLVKILVTKFLNKGVDYDDLYQVGSMALVFAVERFDASRGFGFSSFAAPTIIGEIKRYFRDKCWSLKVPRRQKEIASAIPTVKEALRQKLLRSPTVSEIAAQMGLSDEDVLEALESSANYNALSLNQAMEENAEGESATLEKFTGIREAGYESVDNSDVVQQVMKTFNEREMSVFRGRFLQGRTQKEMADALQVSQMTVSRVENEIRQKFRTEYYK